MHLNLPSFLLFYLQIESEKFVTLPWVRWKEETTENTTRGVFISNVREVMSSQNRGLSGGNSAANVLDLKELLQRTVPKKPQELSQLRPVSQSSSLSSQPMFTQSSVFSQNFSGESLHLSGDTYMGGLPTKTCISKDSALSILSPSTQQSNAKIISLTRQLNLAQKRLQNIQKEKHKVTKGNSAIP